ncbi:MAG: Mrp/NBP35 family ATP-binding protein [Ichthyobacteriaceae bacterium]|nr:Mrp/NBP35 family ATP-binding protein [Ichthyobacteriaceae bacterium]
MSIQRADVLEALKVVKLPSTDNNIVEGGAIQEVVISGDKISIVAKVNTPVLHVKKAVENGIEEALKAAFPSAIVNVTMQVEMAKPVIEEEVILPNIKNIVAVASGKGGVGKSTITANLAVQMAKMGFKVGLVDADIYGPSMPIMFDVEKERPLGKEVNGKQVMVPVENYGVKLLSIGFFTDPDQAVAWRGSMATKALKQIIFDADWGELDFLLIDLPPGTGDIHLTLVQSVPVTAAVVVSTPQIVALADARKGAGLFNMDAIKVPVLGFIENMAYFTPAELPENKYYIFGKDGTKKLAADMGLPVLAEIPLVQSIREAGDIGRPISLQENTPEAKAFYKMTQNVVEETIKRNKNLPPTEKVRMSETAGCTAN